MKLVLFDIDGTLISMKKGISKRLFNDVINEIFNLDTPLELMPDFSGMTDLSILREISKIHNFDYSLFENKLDEIFELKLKKFKEFCKPEFVILHKGINELLISLSENKDIALGLLTGNFKLNAYQKIQSYQLAHYFEFGAFGDDNENRNLLPQIAIDRANKYYNNNLFNTENTFIIGDSERDIECAKTNGINVIITLTGGREFDFINKFEPNLILDDLSKTKLIYDYILN